MGNRTGRPLLVAACTRAAIFSMCHGSYPWIIGFCRKHHGWIGRAIVDVRVGAHGKKAMKAFFGRGRTELRTVGLGFEAQGVAHADVIQDHAEKPRIDRQCPSHEDAARAGAFRHQKLRLRVALVDQVLRGSVEIEDGVDFRELVSRMVPGIAVIAALPCARRR